MMTNVDMPATAFLLAVISPLVVAALRKAAWSQAHTDLAAAVVVIGCYILGQAFDAQLTWPLSGTFWLGLFAAFGVQQAAVKFAWSDRVLQALEAFGNDAAGRAQIAARHAAQHHRRLGLDAAETNVTYDPAATQELHE